MSKGKKERKAQEEHERGCPYCSFLNAMIVKYPHWGEKGQTDAQNNEAFNHFIVNAMRVASVALARLNVEQKHRFHATVIADSERIAEEEGLVPATPEGEKMPKGLSDLFDSIISKNGWTKH